MVGTRVIRALDESTWPAYAERFDLEPGEKRYDLAFAVRVGVFYGRHDAHRPHAIACVRRTLTSQGRLMVDGGDPLREIDLGDCDRQGPE